MKYKIMDQTGKIIAKSKTMQGIEKAWQKKVRGNSSLIATSQTYYNDMLCCVENQPGEGYFIYSPYMKQEFCSFFEIKKRARNKEEKIL